MKQKLHSSGIFKYFQIFFLLLFTSISAQDLDNKGRDFIFGFLPNLSGPTIELHLTADANTMVTINYPVNSPTFTTTVAVNPGNVTIVSLPAASAQGWTAGSVQNNAVRAFADDEFVCYMINRSSATSDAALALPVDVMNNEYIVMTYNSTIVAQDRSEFVVVAGFDNTTVTITPKQNLAGGFAAGTPFDITLDKGEGFLAQGTTNGAAGDLTGTIITSDKPVGMTNGNLCTNVPPNVTFCDHIFEVAQPVQTWGSEIYVANLPNRPGGTIYRVAASQDNTTIMMDGALLATIDRGEFVETDMIDGSHVFSGDKPIYVAQYMTGDSNPDADQGDPAMGNMIPSEQYLNAYTFSTVGANQFVKNFVTIIARNTDVGSLQLDGAAIPAGEFSPIAGTVFSSTVQEITSGTHTTASINGHGITVEGINNFDSYIYPGGARFKFINPVGDANPPICTIEILRDAALGSARDNRPSEDTNNNDVLDPGEDLNSNGLIDEDTGIFFVVLEPGSVNLQLDVDPFVPGAGIVNYQVSLIDPNLPGNGTVTATDGAGNTCSEDIQLGEPIELEGQSFIAVMLGKNEVPPVDVDASGGGMFILNETQDSLFFWIRICELTCPFTAAHFHNGAAGVNGPVVKTLTPLFVQEGESYVAQGVWTSSDAEPLTPALVAELLNGNIYVNAHTTGFPTGEIRGQLTWNEPVELYANLDGAQEVPPVITPGSGEGSFILKGDGTELEYEVMVENLSADISASHFHRAPFGTAGPVVRGIDFVGNTSTGTWKNTDAQPLTPSLVADLLGCWIYVNVHTPNNPAGEIRGQLFKTKEVEQSYMTIWAAKSNEAQDNSVFSFYNLAEGNEFRKDEGDIIGYIGKKNIVDLTIDIGGNFYFLNNSWTSVLFRINPDEIDFDPSTPLKAKHVGRIRTSEDNLIDVSNIRFIRGKLYAINNENNKLYEVSQFDAMAREIADLSSLESKSAGFTFAADGNVYLLKNVDESRSELWKFDKFPSSQLSLVTEVSALDKLESLTAHPNGKLYAADRKNFYEINLAEKTVGILENHIVEAGGLDFDFNTERHEEPVNTLGFIPLNGLTDVKPFSGIPDTYSLAQNYPNPFNPNTNIRYSLPEAGFVRLNIYNSLGEIVKTLVNENLDAGTYETVFDASGLPSGIYIYKLEAGNFTSSYKMILMK